MRQPVAATTTEAPNDCAKQNDCTEHDEVAHLIAWHDGDVSAAIRSLLEDCHHLRGQLALAKLAMGYGYTRGWQPAEERGNVG